MRDTAAHLEQRWRALCKDNMYTTTVCVINSALVKLLKVSKAEKVYCSLSNAVERDENFFEAKGANSTVKDVCGGCEVPFISASRDKNAVMRTAIATSASIGSANSPVVLEVSPKLVDRAAHLGWLSQYPGEQEAAFPALTGIETTGYRVEEIKEGAVLIIETSPIINPNEMTFEEVTGRKKKIVSEACATLSRNLEKTLGKCFDMELPFEVQVIGAGDRSTNGVYRLELCPESAHTDRALPRWVQVEGGRAIKAPEISSKGVIQSSTWTLGEYGQYQAHKGASEPCVPLQAEWEGGTRPPRVVTLDQVEGQQQKAFKVDVAKRKADANKFMSGLLSGVHFMERDDKWYNRQDAFAAVLRFLPAVQKQLLRILPTTADVFAFEQASKISVIALQALEPSRCTKIVVRESADLKGLLEPSTLDELARDDVLVLTTDDTELRLPNFIILTDLGADLKLLKGLKRLSLKGCAALASLPDGLASTEALTALDLSGCALLASKLTAAAKGSEDADQPQTADSKHNLEILAKLKLTSLKLEDWNGEAAAAALDLAADGLSQLTELSLRRAELTSLPRCFETGTLIALEDLDLADCGLDKCEVNSNGLASCKASLTRLNVSGCKLSAIQLGDLDALRKLSLNGCKELTSDSVMLPCKLEHLRWCNGGPNLTSLPESLPKTLKTIRMRGCRELAQLHSDFPQLASLELLELSDCLSLNLGTGSDVLPDGLKQLILNGCAGTTLPSGLEKLQNLQELDLGGCTLVSEIPGTVLEAMRVLHTLDVSGCKLIRKLPDVHLPPHLTKFKARDLPHLKDLPSKLYSESKQLEVLDFGNCSRLRELPPMHALTALRSLALEGCQRLRELPTGFGNLSCLEVLRLNRCKALKCIPDEVANLTNLEWLNMQGCSRIEELPEELGNLSNLGILIVFSSNCLRKMPDSVSRMKKLRQIDMYFCSGIASMPNLSSLIAQGLVLDCSSAPFLERWKQEGYLALNANASEKEASEKSINTAKAGVFKEELKETPTNQVAVLLAEELRGATTTIEYKQAVIESIGQLVPTQVAECIPVLEEQISNAQAETKMRTAAVGACARLHTSKLVELSPKLVKLLEADGKDELKNEAVNVLLRLPFDQVRPSMPTLVDCLLSGKDGRIGPVCERVFSEFEPGDMKTYVNKIRNALSIDEQRKAGLKMLRLLPPSSWSELIAQVEALAANAEEEHRGMAVQALASQTPEVIARCPAIVAESLATFDHPWRLATAISMMDEDGKKRVADSLLKKLAAVDTSNNYSVAEFLSSSGQSLVSAGHRDKVEELLRGILMSAEINASFVYHLANDRTRITTLGLLGAWLADKCASMFKLLPANEGAFFSLLRFVPPSVYRQLVPLAAKQLEDADPQQRARALRCLNAMPRAAWVPHVDAIAGLCDHETDASVKSQLAGILPKLTRAEVAKLNLEAFLKDSDSGVRDKAIRAIARLEAAHAQVHKIELLKLLGDKETSRPTVIKALGKLAHDADVRARLEELIEGLARDLSDPLTLDRSCESKLDELGAMPPHLLGASEPLLKSIEAILDTGYRKFALTTILAKLEGRLLERFVTKILLLLEDPDDGTRVEALLVFLRLPAESQSPHEGVASCVQRKLLSGLKRQDALGQTLEYLARMPPPALAKHAACVSPLLDHWDSNIALAAANALAKLEASELRTHTDALVTALAHADWRVQRAALAALETLEAGALKPEHQAAMGKALEVVVQGRDAHGFADD